MNRLEVREKIKKEQEKIDREKLDRENFNREKNERPFFLFFQKILDKIQKMV